MRSRQLSLVQKRKRSITSLTNRVSVDSLRGLVVRYSYLWSHEAASGRDEGIKDRPCAVLLAVRDFRGRDVVTVLPVTHVPPSNPAHAIEIPAAVKRRLGLDDDRSWIVLTEINDFLWPGPDLRPLPGQNLSTTVFGELPAVLYRRIRDEWLALQDAGRVTRVRRTE